MIAFLDMLNIPTQAALFVVDLAWKSTLLLLVAGGITFCLRKKSAALRHAVWHWTFVALLMLPEVAWYLPGWGPARLIESEASQSVAVSSSQGSNAAPARDRSRMMSDSQEAGRVLPVIVNEHAASTTSHDGEQSTSSNIPMVQSSSAPQESGQPRTGAGDVGTVSAVEHAAAVPRWPGDAVASAPGDTPRQSSRLPLTIWSVGCVLALLPLLIGTWRVERMRRRSLAVNHSTWRRLLSQVASCMRLQSPVELKSSEQVAGPLAGGVWRPFVLLPQSHADWPEDRCHSVLLHELAHIARRDVLKQWLACLACAIFWMHPLAWLAAWRLRVERERACDDAVLSLGTRPSDYSQHLLDIATSYRSPRWLAVSAMTMARSSQLRDRIERILDPDRPRTSPSLRVVTSMALGILLLAGTVATAGRVIVRDSNGSVVATVTIPDGGSVTIDESEDANDEEADGNGDAMPTLDDDMAADTRYFLEQLLKTHPHFSQRGCVECHYFEDSPAEQPIGTPLEEWGHHSNIDQQSCAECHQLQDWSDLLPLEGRCPEWPRGVVISDDDLDGILEIEWSQLHPFQQQPAPASTSEEMYRRLSLDILGRLPTEEELQQLREREENLKRELMQRVVDELLDKMTTEQDVETIHQQLDRLKSELDALNGADIDRERVNALWNDLFDDPREAAIDALILDPSESMSSDVDSALNDFDAQFQSLHGFDFRVNSDANHPRSSGLLPASVEQPRELWQIETVHPRGPIVGMELSANGRYLAFTNSGVVRIVDFDRLLTGYTSLGASEVQQVYAGTPYHNRGAPLAWEPDASWTAGGWLAVGTCEGTVRLLQTDGDCLPVLQTDDPIVVGVCWSPGAKLIAAAGNQGQVTIWDRSWKRVQEFRCDSPLSSIDWSPDGTKLLMADHNHGLQIWTTEGEHVRTIETPAERNELATWSDDGAYIASTSSESIGAVRHVVSPPGFSSPIHRLEVSEGNGGKFWVWTAEGELHKGSSLLAPIYRLEWDQNEEGSVLHVASEVSFVSYHPHDGHYLVPTAAIPLPKDHPLCAIALREDGSIAVGDAAGNLHLRQAGSERFAKITGTVGEFISVTISPDGDLTAVCGESIDGTGFVTLINIDGEIETHLRLPARVTGVTWSPDGMWFVPIIEGEPTRIWKRDGTRLGDLGPGVFDFIEWQPVELEGLEPDDGRYIAAASGDQRLVFSVTNRGEDIEPMPIESAELVTALSWNPTGQIFFTGSVDGSVTGCNASPSSEAASHLAAVEFMAWSPDGALLATACGPLSEDHTVRFWNYKNELIEVSDITLTGTAPVTALAWSRDSQTLLVTRVDNTFATYNTGGELMISQMLSGVMAHDAEWDPMRDRFAMATSNGVIEIMHADGTGEMTLQGHSGRVTDIDWSPNGDRLTAVAEDGTARCWNSANGETAWIFVPAGADQAVTLRPDGVLLSRLAGTPDSAFIFVGGTEGRQEVHPCQFGPAEVIWDAIENN